MKLKERFLAPTPQKWQNVRNIMVAIGLVSGAIIATPAVLPVTLVTLATYGLTIGTIGAALSQLTVEKKK